MSDAKGRNNSPLSTAKGDNDAVGYRKSVIKKSKDPQFTCINTTDPLNFSTGKRPYHWNLFTLWKRD